MMSESLNQNDSMVLFGTDKVETVALLSQSEMVDTQGAGWWSKIRNKVVNQLKKPDTIFAVIYTGITIAFPPAASVTIPKVYSKAIWTF
jgi:hypothetical protein